MDYQEFVTLMSDKVVSDEQPFDRAAHVLPALPAEREKDAVVALPSAATGTRSASVVEKRKKAPWEAHPMWMLAGGQEWP